MRFLYITDTHIRGTSPRSRIDDYQLTLKRKLNEVKEIVKQQQIDIVLHGGDVFDRPNLSPAVVRDFVQCFQQFEVPIYAVAGNHDMYGHNPSTMDRTMLGLLDALGIVKLLHEKQPVLLEKEGRRVQISGQPFHFDLDHRPVAEDYSVINQMKADFCIHLVHGMLVERPLPDGVAYTLLDQLDLPSDADLLLTGHYHAGFPMCQRGKTQIINPGALSRVNNHPSEIERIPQAVLIDVNESIDVQFIPLKSAEAGEQVLDRSYLEQAAYRQSQLTSFVQEIRAVSDFRSIEIADMIEEIAQSKEMNPEVKKEALRRIIEVQEAEGEELA